MYVQKLINKCYLLTFIFVIEKYPHIHTHAMQVIWSTLTSWYLSIGLILTTCRETLSRNINKFWNVFMGVLILHTVFPNTNPMNYWQKKNKKIMVISIEHYSSGMRDDNNVVQRFVFNRFSGQNTMEIFFNID